MITQRDCSAVRKTIEKALQDMPALPDVVTKVLQETEREYASSSDLEKLLGSDQALAGKTLRVVNSAYYGLAGQVSSLSQAVVILGLQQIRNLVLSISALSMMKARTPRQREIQRALWIHSFGTGAGAQIIAKRKRFDSAECELVFLGGLLHDIGKLFLFSNFTDTYQEVLHYSEQRKVPIHEAEALLLGITSQEIGRELVRYWRFPETLANLVGPHLGPFDESVGQGVFAVHVADCLSKHMFESGEDRGESEVHPDVLVWLEFNDEEMEWLKQEMLHKVDAASEFFGLLAA